MLSDIGSFLCRTVTRDRVASAIWLPHYCITAKGVIKAMAFDAGMLCAVIDEIKNAALGARIEKVFQPGKDEIVLQMRSFEGGKRLLINVGSGNSRMCFTELSMENPQNPPMFCMLLRKHLNGARLSDVRQIGFERVAVLEFVGRDEMGFECTRSLVVEIMGKYSNLIFLDGTELDGKILSALRIVDFTTSSQRQVLPGMRYELPPSQGKKPPLNIEAEEFFSDISDAPDEMHADKFIMNTYQGISAAVAREIAFGATGYTDTPLKYCDTERLYESFSCFVKRIKTRDFSPVVVYEGTQVNAPEGGERTAGKAVEYCFMPLAQYGGLYTRNFDSVSKMLDAYFGSRDRETRVHQRAADILKLLTNAEARIRKKSELQKKELLECERGEEYKRMGDLIVANMYALERGMKKAELVDYSSYDEASQSYPTVTVELDERLSPAANAQRLFKKYNKSKVARVELTKQLELSDAELKYIYTVFDALSRAETVTDLAEIREELYRSGYASKMRTYVSHKQSAPSVSKYRTTNGYTVLCGRNNVQNEYITHKMADKNDFWFHAKDVPGSHVVLLVQSSDIVGEDGEPPMTDFTEAAEIAAYNSNNDNGANNVAVDYTKVRYIKKPPAAKPGYVIYHTYWTAYVSPNGDKIEKMKIK